MKRLLLPIAAAVALAGCGEPPAEIAPERRLVRSGRTVAERLAELVAEKGMLRLETPAEARG